MPHSHHRHHHYHIPHYSPSNLYFQADLGSLGQHPSDWGSDDVDASDYYSKSSNDMPSLVDTPSFSLSSKRQFHIVSDRQKDSAVKAAVKVQRNHFTNARGKPIKTPFFTRQLQVLYEADFFPWVIKDALAILEQEAHLVCIESQQIPGFGRLKNVKEMKFYATPKPSQLGMSFTGRWGKKHTA
jgi:hypothetical protein